MYNNRTTDIIIDYDPDIISKIKEMIEAGFDKLKSFVKSKIKSKFDIYYELDKKFNDIALKLEKFDFLREELDYFLLLTDQILYIVYQNCKNSTFGYCDFALELFDFFIDIWNSKIKLSENYSEIELKKYTQKKIEFKKKYHEYRQKFYWNIYEYSSDFDEKETYEFAKTLRK